MVYYVHLHTHQLFKRRRNTVALPVCGFGVANLGNKLFQPMSLRQDSDSLLTLIDCIMVIFIVALSPAHYCRIYAEPSPWRRGVVALTSLVDLQFTLGLLLATLFPRWLQLLGVEIAGVLMLLAVRADCWGDATACFSPCSQYVVILPFPWTNSKNMYGRLLKKGWVIKKLIFRIST